MRSRKESKHSQTFYYLKTGIWDNNPIFVSVLGLCSSLAVTTQTHHALIMGGCVIFVTSVSSLIISLCRTYISEHLRMVLYMLIISTFVIMIDFQLKIFLPKISSALGPYVGLIITNCIIMGRVEAFAIKNTPQRSFLDALSSGIGYTIVVALVAIIREVLGSGTFFGFQIFGERFSKFGLFGIAPGAFFVLGGLSIFFNWMKRDRSRKKKLINYQIRR